MTPERTALVLIGYQNDYFADDGILHGVLEDRERVAEVRARTVRLVERLASGPTTIIATPILFTDDYSELVDPVGILKTISEVGAFRRGTKGGETIPELVVFGDRIQEIAGKRGLNAFTMTSLDETLRAGGIEHVVIAGVVTSICIDSTGRSAMERGYAVTVLSDCTAGRTTLEQDFYCSEIFPLYASVEESEAVAEVLLGIGHPAKVP